MTTARGFFKCLIILFIILCLNTSILSIFASDLDEDSSPLHNTEYTDTSSPDLEEEYYATDNSSYEADTAEDADTDMNDTEEEGENTSTSDEDFSDSSDPFSDEDLDDNADSSDEEYGYPIFDDDENVEGSIETEEHFQMGDSTNKTLYITKDGDIKRIKRSNITTDETDPGSNGESKADGSVSTDSNKIRSSYVRILPSDDDTDTDTDTDPADDTDVDDAGTGTDTDTDTDTDPADDTDADDDATGTEDSQEEQDQNTGSEDVQEPSPTQTDETAAPVEMDTNTDQADAPDEIGTIRTTNFQETAFDYSDREENAADITSVSFSGRRILLADDNADNRKNSVETLSQWGFEVETAESGQAAVDMVSGSAPGTYDLILMDIEMPGMSGYEAAKMIRGLEDKQIAEVPIIAMMDSVTSEEIMATEQAGMQGYIIKNASIEEALQVISSALR